MSNIDHQHLRELWSTQQQRCQAWREGLLKGAFDLREKISEKLQAPDSWTDPLTNIEHRYIEIISLTDNSKPKHVSDLYNDITEKGELPIGVSIALGGDASTISKSIVHAPIAIRFNDGQLQYRWWDSKAEDVTSQDNWEPDINKFIVRLINEIKDCLQHDPRDGTDKKTQIGFV